MGWTGRMRCESKSEWYRRTVVSLGLESCWYIFGGIVYSFVGGQNKKSFVAVVTWTEPTSHGISLFFLFFNCSFFFSKFENSTCSSIAVEVVKFVRTK